VRGGAYDYAEAITAHTEGSARPGGMGPAPPVFATPPKSNKQLIEEDWTVLHDSMGEETCSEDWVDLNYLQRKPREELQKLVNGSDARKTRRKQRKALLDSKRLNATPVYYRFEGNRTDALSKGNMTVSFDYAKWDKLEVSSSDSGERLIPRAPPPLPPNQTASLSRSRALAIQEIARQGLEDCRFRCRRLEDGLLERRLNSDSVKEEIEDQTQLLQAGDGENLGAAPGEWACSLCQHKNPDRAKACSKCEWARDVEDHSPSTQQPWTAADEKNLQRVREMRRFLEKLHTPDTCAKAESLAKLMDEYARELDALEIQTS